ncbi:MAG TPA: 50S ribosomal protein L18 [Actinomycetota bacterium]|nr:50S ribosomal protein L18 [Actinomycetota bacterium]
MRTLQRGNDKRSARARRRLRVRRKISGTPARPRLAVYRSNRHIYAQLIDDVSAHTVASASDREVRGDGTKGDKTVVAKAVGALIADRAKQAGVQGAVFDRGGRLYHGRIAALAEGAREGGLAI